MPRWFYKRDDGQEFGPLTERGMRELFVRGRLTASSAVKQYDLNQPDKSYPWVTWESSALGTTATAEEEPLPPPSPFEVLMEQPERPKHLPRLYQAVCWATVLWFVLLILYALLGLPQLFTEANSGLFLERPMLHWLSWMDDAGVLLLLIYLVLVMAWQSFAVEVNSLAGAEILVNSGSSVVQWLVPGWNLYYSKESVKEVSSLAKDPKAWSRRGVRTTPLLDFWWFAFVGANLAAIAKITIRKNLGAALTDGRMTDWQGKLSAITAARDLLWAAHLALFILLIWQITRTQRHSLLHPQRRKVRTD
jgi:hypothetical protein